MLGQNAFLEFVELLEFPDSLGLGSLGLRLGVSAVTVSIADVPEVEPSLKNSLDNCGGPCLAIGLGLEFSQVELLGRGPCLTESAPEDVVPAYGLLGLSNVGNGSWYVNGGGVSVFQDRFKKKR